MNMIIYIISLIFKSALFYWNKGSTDSFVCFFEFYLCRKFRLGTLLEKFTSGLFCESQIKYLPAALVGASVGTCVGACVGDNVDAGGVESSWIGVILIFLFPSQLVLIWGQSPFALANEKTVLTPSLSSLWKINSWNSAS